MCCVCDVGYWESVLIETFFSGMSLDCLKRITIFSRTLRNIYIRQNYFGTQPFFGFHHFIIFSVRATTPIHNPNRCCHEQQHQPARRDSLVVKRTADSERPVQAKREKCFKSFLFLSFSAIFIVSSAIFHTLYLSLRFVYAMSLIAHIG